MESTVLQQDGILPSYDMLLHCVVRMRAGKRDERRNETIFVTGRSAILLP